MARPEQHSCGEALATDPRPVKDGWTPRPDSGNDAMNSKNRSTLADIRRDPVLSSIPWAEIENLFRALGAVVSEGSG